MNASTLTLSQDTTPRHRMGVFLFIAGALLAFCVTTYRYVVPLSGVNDTYGALLAASSEFVLILAGLLLTALHSRRGASRVVLALAWIIVILTFIAELFLHGWIAAGFLIVAALGLLLRTISGSSGRSV